MQRSEQTDVPSAAAKASLGDGGRDQAQGGGRRGRPFTCRAGHCSRPRGTSAAVRGRRARRWPGGRLWGEDEVFFVFLVVRAVFCHVYTIPQQRRFLEVKGIELGKED